jgi:lipopolysaccharide export LptBFGC system permease protein LptF
MQPSGAQTSVLTWRVCPLRHISSLPLGIRPVRTGRSWGALIAMTVMAAYWLVLSAGQLAAEAGMIPPASGLWAADILAVALAIALIHDCAGLRCERPMAALSRWTR